MNMTLTRKGMLKGARWRVGLGGVLFFGGAALLLYFWLAGDERSSGLSLEKDASAPIEGVTAASGVAEDAGVNPRVPARQGLLGDRDVRYAKLEALEVEDGQIRSVESARNVWINQAEVLAGDLLEGRLVFDEAAGMLANLIESAVAEGVEWELVDGVNESTLFESEELGKAVLMHDLSRIGGDGEYKILMSFVDPPGLWAPGEANQSTLEFQFQIGKAGDAENCSALLNQNFRRGIDGGPRDNFEPLESGAVLRVSKDGTFQQSVMTVARSDGNREYSLAGEERVGSGDLGNPEINRLSRILSHLRRK